MAGGMCEGLDGGPEASLPTWSVGRPRLGHSRPLLLWVEGTASQGSCLEVVQSTPGEGGLDEVRSAGTWPPKAIPCSWFRRSGGGHVLLVADPTRESFWAAWVGTWGYTFILLPKVSLKNYPEDCMLMTHYCNKECNRQGPCELSCKRH